MLEAMNARFEWAMTEFVCFGLLVPLVLVLLSLFLLRRWRGRRKVIDAKPWEITSSSDADDRR